MFFLLLSHPAVSLSSYKRKNAVPADWRLDLHGLKRVGCVLWAVGWKSGDWRGRGCPRICTDWHGLASGLPGIAVQIRRRFFGGKSAVPADWRLDLHGLKSNPAIQMPNSPGIFANSVLISIFSYASFSCHLYIWLFFLRFFYIDCAFLSKVL